MKLNSVFFYSLLTLSVSQLTMNTNVWAKNQEDAEAERWFEIEVILFKQLGNKAELKEQFPTGINALNLPKYKETFDLFTPYLQPNLTGVKQFMPLCDDNNKPGLFIDSLQNIAQVSANPKLKTIIDTEQATIQAPFQQTTEQSYVASFEFDLQKEDLANPIFSTKNLCIITQKEINNILDKEQLSHFNIDSFGVDALPSRLNASGIHNSEQPYLMADESLLLKDISQNLRWSREFQPLLHFGWRQVGVTEKEAIPLKLVSGEHLEQQYRQALTKYQAEVKQANAIEHNLLEQITQNQDAIDEELTISVVQKQHALTKLFSKIDAMEKNTPSKTLYNTTTNNNEVSNREVTNSQIDNDTISDIVSSLSKQDLNSILAHQNTDTSQDSDPKLDNKLPKAPLQPWFLDGFLKVHLDHYLYITADFNVLNQDPGASLTVNPSAIIVENDKTVLEANASSNASSDEAKLINFSQNRRVITGEIHYFDHPYIGMIIQIRRFDPTQPIGERVSQAKK